MARHAIIDRLKTEVELSVSAHKLRDATSSPMCVLYTMIHEDKGFVEVGRTEIIKNSANPIFVTKFNLDFFFEEKQRLRFELYDVDDVMKSDDLSRQGTLGYMECTLGYIVSSITAEKKLVPIKHEISEGSLRVLAEELKQSKEELTLKFIGDNIKRKKTFLQIDSETAEETGWKRVYETDRCPESADVTWPEINITVRSLCNGDYDRRIRIACLEFSKSGRHQLLGESYTTVRNLTRGPAYEGNTMLLTTSGKGNDSKDTDKKLILRELRCITQTTFLDYIQAGTSIQVTVAIDFTSSNGNPSDPRSLHYSDEHQESTYVRAIKQIVPILEEYDSDRKIPAIGFGAQCSEEAGNVDMFALNGNLYDMECDGVDGVLEAYKDSLAKVRLSGPTNFATVIDYMAEQAAEHREGSMYHILLMMTDGCISDMIKTKKAIIAASSLPLSIIIVGMGDEDFEPMKVLDGDHALLSSRGLTAERDIVQFVEFNKYMMNNNNQTHNSLSKAVLEEVPGQITGFMSSHKIHPRSLSRRMKKQPNMQAI